MFLKFQCSDKLGLSLELGSFAAGVMISTTDLAQHTLEQVRLCTLCYIHADDLLWNMYLFPVAQETCMQPTMNSRRGFSFFTHGYLCNRPLGGESAVFYKSNYRNFDGFYLILLVGFVQQASCY